MNENEKIPNTKIILEAYLIHLEEERKEELSKKHTTNVLNYYIESITARLAVIKTQKPKIHFNNLTNCYFIDWTPNTTSALYGGSNSGVGVLNIQKSVVDDYLNSKNEVQIKLKF